MCVTITCAIQYLGAFEKLRKATISFLTSARLSVRMQQLGSHGKDCNEIFCVRIFRKSVEKIKSLLKFDKKNEYFTWRLIYIFIISRSILLRIRNIRDKVVEKIKGDIFCSMLFLITCLLWDNVEKYCTAGQVTNDNMAHEHCILVN
jgi:hypothetical protein